MSIRPVKQITGTQPTMEGAGVKLHRVFGFGDPSMTDPFLMMDDFRNDNPGDYKAGFPWHPHRGIETITYVLAGTVDHADSLGNAGTLGPGSVQWMTAGSGILHQELPKGDERGRMHGFQLWAKLPSGEKMTRPRYQDIAGADIPEIVDDDGTRVRVCGRRAGSLVGSRQHASCSWSPSTVAGRRRWPLPARGRRPHLSRTSLLASVSRSVSVSSRSSSASASTRRAVSLSPALDASSERRSACTLERTPWSQSSSSTWSAWSGSPERSMT